MSEYEEGHRSDNEEDKEEQTWLHKDINFVQCVEWDLLEIQGRSGINDNDINKMYLYIVYANIIINMNLNKHKEPKKQNASAIYNISYWNIIKNYGETSPMHNPDFWFNEV
jgi:hypothetical protein